MVKSQYQNRPESRDQSGLSAWPDRSALAFLCLVLLVNFASSLASAASDVGLTISRIGDASHFEFTGNREWKYELKKVSSGGGAAKDTASVMLRLPGLKSDALKRLKTYSDVMVKGVAVNEAGVDGTVEVLFTISGAADFFDYLTEQPSRLVVDFFPKDVSRQEDKAAKARVQSVQSKASSENLAEKTKSDSDDDSDDDSGDDEDESIVVKNLPKKKAVKVARDSAAAGVQGGAAKGKRTPAGGDMVLVAGAGPAKVDPLPNEAAQANATLQALHGIYDGGDPEFRRFTMKDYEIKDTAIAASHVQVYLPFPMLELGSPHLKSLLAAPPIYEIIPNNSQENKEARLLLTLFSNHRPALFLQTAEEFLKKYPDTRYDEIVRYMMADTHFEIYRSEGSNFDFESAIGLYTHLSEKYPESPLTERTLLLTGYAYLERNDSFGALKTFQRFVRLKPNSKLYDQVRVSIADAYLKLDRFDDAYQLLDEVEKTAKTTRSQQEAAYRKGDVFFRKKDFPESIRQYKLAEQKYPDAVQRFPNAGYNTAEADFISNHYRDGLEDYRTFLQRFPDHEHGGYAMTRMGELLQILGAEPKRVNGAYLESNFRYRGTPGAGVARIRFLTDRMAEMKDKELADAKREVAAITEAYSNHPPKKPKLIKDPKTGQMVPAPQEGEKTEEGAEATVAKEGEAAAPKEGASPEGGEAKSKEGGGEGAKEGASKVAALPKKEKPQKKDPLEKLPELPGIEEFSTILSTDAMRTRGEFDQAATELITYFQKNPRSPNHDKIHDRIVENLVDGIKNAVEHGNFIDALRRYSRHSGGWLKNAGRTDLTFNVAKAYEQAGVYKEATAKYRETLAEVNKKSGAKSADFVQNIFEKRPKADSIQLRLAVVAAHDKKLAEAESDLKAIKGEGQLTAPEQIERAGISADIAEARGDGERAQKFLSDLIKNWKNDPKLTSPLRLRLAKILGAKKSFIEADEQLAKIMRSQNEDGGEPDEVVAGALELRAELQLARGKRKEAVATYRKLLETFGGTRALGAVRYKVGEILFADGDLKGAEEIWADLKPEKDEMWTRLASEQMKSAKWQDEYKKYINRIPAAANLKN